MMMTMAITMMTMTVLTKWTTMRMAMMMTMMLELEQAFGNALDRSQSLLYFVPQTSWLVYNAPNSMQNDW